MYAPILHTLYRDHGFNIEKEVCPSLLYFKSRMFEGIQFTYIFFFCKHRNIKERMPDLEQFLLSCEIITDFFLA